MFLLDEILRDRPVAAYVVHGRGGLVDLTGRYPGTYTVTAGITNGGAFPEFEAAWALVPGSPNRARSTANVPASLTGDAEFSIEMFFVPRSFGGDNTYNGWGTSATALTATGLWANSGGVLRCEYAGGNTANGSAAAAMVANRPYHVVYTKTPGAIAATSKFYLNGVDTGACTGSANTPNLGATPFAIGQWADYTDAGGNSGDAIWQVVAFYAKALDLPSAVRHLRAAYGHRAVASRRLRAA